MGRNVVIAKSSGFCFGVERATGALEKRLKEKSSNEKIYTLGHLIHNDEYNKMLEEQGVLAIAEENLEEIAKKATTQTPITLFVRAHGITKECEAKLCELSKKYDGFSYVDCTCPYVKKIQKIAHEESGEDRYFCLLGSKTHPEVKGIMSYVRGEGEVFENSDELEEFLKSEKAEKLLNLHKRTAVLCAQTTQNLCEWEKSCKILKKLYTNSIFFDTICNVTEIRQNEARALSKECDLMVVVGGRDSSNTKKLYNICKEECENTVFISDSRELTSNYPTFNKIGIVAGASTPKSSIGEVFLKMSEMENFEELLEQSIKTLNTGDTVKGYVINVTDNELQLDIGAKVTGIIKADQITDDPTAKLTTMFKRGDEVEAFVIRVSDIEGVAELSKKRTDSDKNWKTIVADAKEGKIVNGKVVSAVKGGLSVVVDSVRVFVPASQTGIAKDGDVSELVGQNVDLKIIETKDYGKKAIGSIKTVLNAQKKEKEAEFWADIEEGKKYEGIVHSLTNYGAFVDLGGVDGMVHVSELSWRSVKHPSEIVKVGDKVNVFVKSFDKESGRISLGYKTDDTNPWLLFVNKYQVGDVVSVKIVNMMPFGAFAEIMEGVDGLIHISKIANRKIGKPADVLEIGQVVDAKIIEIDNEKQKVSLSIRDLIEEAEAEAEAMPEAETATEEAAVEAE